MTEVLLKPTVIDFSEIVHKIVTQLCIFEILSITSFLSKKAIELLIKSGRFRQIFAA